MKSKILEREYTKPSEAFKYPCILIEAFSCTKLIILFVNNHSGIVLDRGSSTTWDIGETWENADAVPIKEDSWRLFKGSLKIEN